MTERRFRRGRRHGMEPMQAAAATAIVLGALVIIGFDHFARGEGNRFSAVRSIDPLAGGVVQASAASPPPAPRPLPMRASMLPGELVVEGVEPLHAQLLLEDRLLPPPPVVIDSLAPGTHAISVVEGDSVLWRTDVSLDAGGIAHVVVPAMADSSDSTR